MPQKETTVETNGQATGHVNGRQFHQQVEHFQMAQPSAQALVQAAQAQYQQMVHQSQVDLQQAGQLLSVVPMVITPPAQFVDQILSKMDEYTTEIYARETFFVELR